MVVGIGQSPIGEYIENENTMQVRKHDRYESGHGTLRVREMRSLLPWLYASHSLEHRKQSRTISLKTYRAVRTKENHRVPAIALTRMIPQAPAAHPGALVCP